MQLFGKVFPDVKQKSGGGSRNIFGEKYLLGDFFWEGENKLPKSLRQKYEALLLRRAISV